MAACIATSPRAKLFWPHQPPLDHSFSEKINQLRAHCFKLVLKHYLQGYIPEWTVELPPLLVWCHDRWDIHAYAHRFIRSRSLQHKEIALYTQFQGISVSLYLWKTIGQDLWGLWVNYLWIHWYPRTSDHVLPSDYLTRWKGLIKRYTKRNKPENLLKINRQFPNKE